MLTEEQAREAINLLSHILEYGTPWIDVGVNHVEQCQFCNGWPDRRPAPHEETCMWIRAEQFLAQFRKPDTPE